ncbi:MAG: TonB-dependent receptor [Gammaproteobacteria bacterium]|nr:TonB-dependent receptor [Gammaproteobacteria bacterium]MDH5303754.1 TonB-dependent receptor [Gammaproteobacteria bacterium]MDH5322284.1 TonB-dependent receptor [Gammaproteobacteria bacterium]
MDEIQVTATRRTTAVGNIATAVNVVTSEQLALRSLVTDALASEVGAFVQETTPGQGAIIIRGMKGSEVVHLVDSMRINNAIFRNAPTQYVALVDPHIIERIEIVRSSLASLYGSDAMGGAANFITHQPQFFTSGGGLRGDASVAAASADAARSISVGAETGNASLAGLARISMFDAGNRQTGDQDARTPFTAYSYHAARLALRAAPDTARTWLLDLQYLQQPKTYRVDELIPGYGQTEPASSEFTFEPNTRAFAHAQYQHGDGLWSADWTVDLGWQRIDDDRTTRNFGSTTRRLEHNASDLLSLNIEAVREAVDRVWVFGLSGQYDTVSSTRDELDLTTGARASVLARFPDQSTVRQSGVYTSLQLDTGARGNVVIGGRLSAVDIAVPGGASIELTDLTGDLGWTFHLTESWDLLANLGRGFRAPNIFDLGTFGERPGNRFNIPNDELAAETVLHMDVGLRHADESWWGELRIFALHYQDKIESVDTGASTADGRIITQSRNLSAVDIEGIEFSADISLTENLNFAAVLNVVRGEIRVPGETNTPADRVPPLNGQLELAWQASERWRLAPSLRFAASQDRLSPRDSNDPRINPQGTPGWVTLNLTAAFQASEQLQFNLGVENLLDKQYRVHGSGLDARGLNFIANASLRW